MRNLLDLLRVILKLVNHGLCMHNTTMSNEGLWLVVYNEYHKKYAVRNIETLDFYMTYVTALVITVPVPMFYSSYEEAHAKACKLNAAALDKKRMETWDWVYGEV